MNQTIQSKIKNKIQEDINNLRKKYDSINYSSTEVNSAIQKLISFPFYLMVMTILASIIMINIKYNKSKIFHLIFVETLLI